MTAGGPGPDEVNALLEDRLAVAEETLRALQAGEVDAIVMDSGQGEQRVYALETQDRPYRLLVERMSEGAAIVDADGLISYANQQLATLLGVPLERLIGRPFSAWLEEPDRSRLMGQLTAAASGRDDEYTLRRLDGDNVAVRLGVSVADEPDGLVRCLTVTDLSDQKARQRQVSQLNAELTDRLAELSEVNSHLEEAQRLETVGQIAGGIAHEFNNLLQVILSYTFFLSETVADAVAQADVAEVEKAAHRAAELTQQLLIVARRDLAQPKVLELNSVIGDIESLLRNSLGEDVALECQSSATPCYVMADAAELDQVVMSLAFNARDAMPQGGSLRIRVQRVDVEGHDKDTAKLPIAAPYALIEVADDGEGMSPDVLAKAFEPFFTTKGRGTGLGLAMVYAIVGRWGGHASIASAAGAGTTVSLLFPLSNEGPTQLDSAGTEQPAPAGRGTVLLVDDEEGVVGATTRILTAGGYHVLGAPNALEATKVFETTPVDILVTDVIMPGGVSGKDLADRLRQVEPDLPVIFMSGYSAEMIFERGVLSPSTQLVKKPFAAAEILQAIADAVAARAAGGGPVVAP